VVLTTGPARKRAASLRPVSHCGRQTLLLDHIGAGFRHHAVLIATDQFFFLASACPAALICLACSSVSDVPYCFVDAELLPSFRQARGIL